MIKNYLNINYKDKNKAKKLGAIWDKNEKKWFYYDDNINKDELLKSFKSYDNNIIELIGENRTFGGNELYIDMIPKTSYFKNVRSLFSNEDWNIIRHYIYKRVNYKCECCGSFKFKYLEAHERWSFDIENKIQKLERIIALCKLCHKTVHYGHSKIRNNMEKINNHIKKVKKINDEELDNHINESKNIWKERNKINWILDLSIISNSGFTIIT